MTPVRNDAATPSSLVASLPRHRGHLVPETDHSAAALLRRDFAPTLEYESAARDHSVGTALPDDSCRKALTQVKHRPHWEWLSLRGGVLTFAVRLAATRIDHDQPRDIHQLGSR